MYKYSTCTCTCKCITNNIFLQATCTCTCNKAKQKTNKCSLCQCQLHQGKIAKSCTWSMLQLHCTYVYSTCSHVHMVSSHDGICIMCCTLKTFHCCGSYTSPYDAEDKPLAL